MTAAVDLTPQVVNLKLLVGDDPLLRWQFWTDATKAVPLDVSSYASWEAEISSRDGQTILMAVDVSAANTGIVTVQVPGSSLVPLPTRGVTWAFSALVGGRRNTFALGTVTLKQDP